MKEEIISINELQQDDHNFNKGTEEGGKLMKKSFSELGAGCNQWQRVFQLVRDSKRSMHGAFARLRVE